MQNRNNSTKVKNGQDHSLLAQVPSALSNYIYSFLDNNSLSTLSRSASFFYVESKMDRENRQKQALSNFFAMLEKKLTEVEADLTTVNGQLTYVKGMGYLFEAHPGPGVDVAKIDYKLQLLVPKIRSYLLSSIFTFMHFSKQGINMGEDFEKKLDEVRNRFEAKLGVITKEELEMIENELKEPSSKSQQTQSIKNKCPACIIL